ncbi:MAG: methylenetetrahydrofolate--tRNA-(uracil(54)-C(5))-methyltransferase (FADH(2)-oxidizing) TrmFO [Candidatus Eremiobacteraeota bacterium]|nr:methylenetetrahydrofolate--tRNA-(uracil(54)-C(5))-methyltransferase (FADH(2)-oxidizing) TrmFO [Candidatus Eremiobacteraeota bacterium]
MCGIDVELYEMRPHTAGPAHQTGNLAELVCSNSLRGAGLQNAVGLLKEELALLDSVIIHSARRSAVPAGGALAVDRARFSSLVETRLTGHPRISIRRQEVTAIDERLPTIVACGPLPSAPLLAEVDRLVGGVGRLHYYDAASPIVSSDSIDETPMYRKSRYEKGDGDDYLNIPLDEAGYKEFVADLRRLPKHEPKDFELSLPVQYFEGCLPIEEMARRGEDVLRFGPLKPVGLRDPRSGKTPFAVVQLRKENLEGTAMNLVGFQTRLTWPSQKEAFGKLPGLAHAEWLRLGVMHRNTFVDSPRLLTPQLRLVGREHVWLAGQITGAEGYVEAAACGAMSAIAAARGLVGQPAVAFPRETAFGALIAHLQNTATPNFQPSNVNWALFPPLDEEIHDKRERRSRLAARALQAMQEFAGAIGRRCHVVETSLAGVG